MERIKRLHARTIWLNQGDTVKLEWTASVSSDQLLLFHCGYKNNALNPTSSSDPPLVTLAYGVSRDEFKIMRLANSQIRDQLRATDSLQLINLASSYHDDLKGSHVMEIKNVPSTIEQAQLGCRLKWKVNGKTETVFGGITKINIRNKPSPCAGKGSSRVRGEIFLGAVLFDFLLVGTLMSVSLLWKRKKTGYQAPKKAPKSKKIKKSKKDKKKKKENKERDLEKGVSDTKSKQNKTSLSSKATKKQDGGDVAIRSERSKTSSSRTPRERKDGTSGNGGGGAKRRTK